MEAPLQQERLLLIPRPQHNLSESGFAFEYSSDVEKPSFNFAAQKDVMFSCLQFADQNKDIPQIRSTCKSLRDTVFVRE